MTSATTDLSPQRAIFAASYSAHTAKQTGYELFQNEAVKERIDYLTSRRQLEIAYTADQWRNDVLGDITTAKDAGNHSAVTNGTSHWVEDGWFERIGLSKESYGIGDSIEDVVGFPIVLLGEIQAYRAVARKTIWPVLNGLNREDLPRTCEERWPLERAAPSVARALARVVVESAQHIGQITYIAGMIRDARRHEPVAGTSAG